jgi:hypothetical protein
LMEDVAVKSNLHAFALFGLASRRSIRRNTRLLWPSTP